MHKSVMTWVSSIVERDGLRSRASILEIGSFNVNGGVRSLFPEANANDRYTGVDVCEGPGVDTVNPDMGVMPDQWTNEFDLVISTEALEHDGRFWRTLSEIRRVSMIKPTPARIILTFRGMRLGLVGDAFPYHGQGHFKDYYRFLPDSVPILADLCGMRVIEWKEDPQWPGLFIYGERA